MCSGALGESSRCGGLVASRLKGRLVVLFGSAEEVATKRAAWWGESTCVFRIVLLSQRRASMRETRAWRTPTVIPCCCCASTSLAGRGWHRGERIRLSLASSNKLLKCRRLSIRQAICVSIRRTPRFTNTSHPCLEKASKHTLHTLQLFSSPHRRRSRKRARCDGPITYLHVSRFETAPCADGLNCSGASGSALSEAGLSSRQVGCTTTLGAGACRKLGWGSRYHGQTFGGETYWVERRPDPAFMLQLLDACSRSLGSRSKQAAGRKAVDPGIRDSSTGNRGTGLVTVLF